MGDKTFALSGDLRDEILREGLTERVRAALVLDRHALHCERIGFDHPMTGENIVIDAAIPPDMARFFV